MFRKYFISLARSCCIYYIHSDSYLLEKSVKYTKIEAVSKGIGSARIPRNQTLRIYLVPNWKRYLMKQWEGQISHLLVMNIFCLISLSLGWTFCHVWECGRFSYSSLFPGTCKAGRVMAGLSDSSKIQKSIRFFPLKFLRHWDEHVVCSKGSRLQWKVHNLKKYVNN